ncbi:MAG: hypothetical protein AAF840_15950 [Bacteroidota bacterium]
MKYLSLGVVALLGLTFSACTSARYASTTEYDDVYYTSEDRTEPVATTQRTQRSNQDDYRYDEYDNRYSERRADVDSYADYYYSDDDFHFSRRLRRFDQNAAAGNWRYYDPYFANDLYFVMGTPSWNRWYNNYGWYNWNSPRFAAPFNPYDPFAARFNTWYSYDLYGPYNAWGSFYTNPWVNTYYGNGFYDPFWGGNNFYRGGVWGNQAYCPPGYFNRGFNSPTFFTTGNTTSSRTAPAVTRVRRSTRTAATQSEIRTRQGSAVSRPSPAAATRTGSTTRTSPTRTSTVRTSPSRTASTRPSSNVESSDSYLRARQRSTTATRVNPASGGSRTRTESVTPAQGRDSYRVNTSGNSSTRRNAPSTNTRVNTNQGYTPSRRTTPSTQQRRTTTPSSRTYTPARSTTPSRNYSPPPSRSNSSFSRPSSSRSSSSVQRSSSPSRSSSSRSSSSSRRRNN